MVELVHRLRRRGFQIWVASASPQHVVEAFAESDHAKRCFVRQSFRFFMGRDERIEDGCTLVAMEDAFDEQGSFIDMLGALVTSDAYLYRIQDADAVCE